MRGRESPDQARCAPDAPDGGRSHPDQVAGACEHELDRALMYEFVVPFDGPVTCTLGHYDPTTNRVFLFDVTSESGGGDWSENAATIIHEAAHQTAYNVGVHKRFTAAPRWLPPACSRPRRAT